MIYLYDKTICDDLRKSFNPDNLSDTVVKFVDTEEIVNLAAQIQNDEIQFPVVGISREGSVSIDKSRMNFTRLHKGVQAVLDEATNNLYYEKSIPIQLNYEITLLTTNIADMDELVREILFKYSDMYFLTMELPYEAKRSVRFGLIIDRDKEIQRSSAHVEYINEGKLYQTLIPLKVEGAVLVTYTPAHLRREAHEVKAVTRPQFEYLKEHPNLI